MITIHTIAATKETTGYDAKDMNYDMTVLSGKFGGTCYAAEGYETIRLQPVEKALKRAENTAARGHHSVFQHCMITMEISCPKIIAMLLNSIGVSNTSEKSARYTKMQPQTEKEGHLYQKWHDFLLERINEIYPGAFSEREADKLAYENARYMISVFCPTTMVYSLPFRNMFYVIDWADGMIANLEHMQGGFNERLKLEMEHVRDAFLQAVGEERNFHDNKNEYFRFMPVQAIGETADDEKEYYGDVYTAKHLASFAEVAQQQRHRTLRVKIHFGGTDAKEYGFYIPELIKGTPLEKVWLTDMESIAEVYPQGTLVSVTEQGLFEDFILKSKERMCGRAQLEIMCCTEHIMEMFIKNKENLSSFNRKKLESATVNGAPCARCRFDDFVCVEGCKWGPGGALGRKV